MLQKYVNKWGRKKQDEFNAVFHSLSAYSPRSKRYTESKNKFLDNVRYFYKDKEKIVEGFKNGTFSIQHDENGRPEDHDENDIRDRNDLIDYKKLNRLTDLKGRDLSDELFRGYFKYQDPSHMLESVSNTKNTERNEIQVNLIKRLLNGFKNKMKSKSETEIEFEKTKWNSGYCWKVLSLIDKINKEVV